jgi:hypothetical protein
VGGGGVLLFCFSRKHTPLFPRIIEIIPLRTGKKREPIGSLKQNFYLVNVAGPEILEIIICKHLGRNYRHSKKFVKVL